MADPSPTTSLVGILASAALETATAMADNNSSVPVIVDPIETTEGSYFLNTLIGLIIVLIASVLNALGLNITKLDHQRQQLIPKRQRKEEYTRPLWLAGMGIYIASQVFGSPLALRFLRPDWVAPLGASSLIFNFMFAYWLVGTPVTTSDLQGTALIVLGVILMIIFSSINHGLKQSISIEELNALWTRGSWIAYFVFLILFISSTYLTSSLLDKVSKSRASFSPMPSPTVGMGGRLPAVEQSNSFLQKVRGIWAKWKAVEVTALAHLERLLQRTDDARVTWLEGIGWAVAGGSLAGLCLVFTKAVVKIYGLPGHPLVHVSAIITLILLIVTAVLQIVCLNKALRCADTVVVVPLFYAGYTVLGFINALIFYNEVSQYATWVLVAVFLSIAVLIGGVVMLSMKPTDEAGSGNTVTTAPSDPAIRMRPGQVGGQNAPPRKSTDSNAERGESEVMWEVGSASDSEEDDDKEEGKGVGGTKDSRGERGGLLLVEDEYEPVSPRPSARRMSSRVEEDEEEEFGGFSGAPRT